MPDGSVWLLKNGKPYGLTKFAYMGLHFWKGIPNEEILEVIAEQSGITFYHISKELISKMILERPDEFTTDDVGLVNNCDEVWLEKNV